MAFLYCIFYIFAGDRLDLVGGAATDGGRLISCSFFSSFLEKKKRARAPSLSQITLPRTYNALSGSLGVKGRKTTAGRVVAAWRGGLVASSGLVHHRGGRQMNDMKTGLRCDGGTGWRRSENLLLLRAWDGTTDNSATDNFSYIFLWRTCLCGRHCARASIAMPCRHRRGAQVDVPAPHGTYRAVIVGGARIESSCSIGFLNLRQSCSFAIYKSYLYI